MFLSALPTRHNIIQTRKGVFQARIIDHFVLWNAGTPLVNPEKILLNCNSFLAALKAVQALSFLAIGI